MARDPMDPNWVEANRRGMTRRMAAGNPELTAAVAAGPGEYVNTAWGADGPAPAEAQEPSGFNWRAVFRPRGVTQAAEPNTASASGGAVSPQKLAYRALVEDRVVSDPTASEGSAPAVPEPIFAEPGRGKMTNAYGVPMAVSNQNGVTTATDSAYDPLHYGVNATGPEGAGYNEWAEANPYAAQQFAADTSAGMQRRSNRIAGENEAAMQQALLLQMPDLPARNLEAQAKMLEAETAAAQAGGGQEAVNKNAEAMDRLFKNAVDRNVARGMNPAAAHTSAMIEMAKTAVDRGIDPKMVPAVGAFMQDMQRSLQEGVDAPYTGLGSFLPGTDYAKVWDGSGTFEPFNPETGAPRALPDFSSYELMGKANPLLAGSDEYKVRRRGPDGRVGTVDLPDNMSATDFERLLHILTSASAAYER